MGHFDYLLTNQQSSHTKLGSERIQALATTAAKRYIEERAPLTGTIQKMASQNDLNSEQIKRVCELANIATHRLLFSKAAAKESVAFPLADAREVADVVSKGNMVSANPMSPPTSSPCSMSSDYDGPPTGIPDSAPSTSSMFGVNPDEVHNGLGDEPEGKRIIIILQKKAAERSDLKSKILYAGMQLEALEKKAFADFKQTVLGGASFYQVYEAVVGMGMGKVAEEYLPKWQQKLIDQSHGSQRLRLEKIAISKAPEELISDNMGNTTVINGAHPVLISLDTVNRKTGEIKQGIHNLLRIDDEVNVFNQRLRELS